MAATDSSAAWDTTGPPVAPDERVVDNFFARMGRDGVEELQRATALLQGVPLLQDVIDAVPLPVALLNEKGQVVLVNLRWSQSLGDDPTCVLGKRHGELLGCLHVGDGSDGCGTAHNCQQCGAQVSIQASRQSQGQALRAYHLERSTPEGAEVLELVVTSTPIEVDGRQFTIFVLQDADTHTLDMLGSPD
jgi:PAS domain-containing protein